MNALFILAIIGLFVTLIILLVGVVGMARGGDFNKKYGNKLMRARVISQFLALVFILLAVMSMD